MSQNKNSILKIIPFVFFYLFVLEVSGQTIIFSEGFNSDFTDRYTSKWHPVFGIANPGIVGSGTNGTNATEGDSFAGLNVSRPSAAAPAVFAGMNFDLGTITEANQTYTFTGDFSWRFGGSTASAADLGIAGSEQSGFKIDNTHAGAPTVRFDFDMAENEWIQHSFSFTTVLGDVGKNLRLRIRLVDEGAVGGITTQLLTDNWKVTVIPENKAYPFLLGIVAFTCLLFCSNWSLRDLDKAKTQ